MQYTDNFSAVKFENFIGKNVLFFFYFAQSMGTRKNRLAKAVITSTHNLCFGPKIRIGIPLHTFVLLYKVGRKGVYISRTCFPDGMGTHTFSQ